MPELSRRRRTRGARDEARDHRSALNRRQANAIQIRKQRKDDLLRRKRQGVDAGSVGSNHETLSSYLDAFLENPMDDGMNLVRFQREMAAGSHDDNAAFLDKLLVENQGKALSLVATLTTCIREGDNLLLPALFVVLDISSVADSRKSIQDHSYYGNAPLKWSDLLFNQSDLVPILLTLLSLPEPERQQVALNILGNLVDDASSRALPVVLPHWTTIVANLPASTFLCAAVVRRDLTHYGRDFLTSLTPRDITNLLNSDSTAVDAAWLLEGLSRREDEAVNCLCADGTLISMLIGRIEYETSTGNTRFLVPALQSIENIATASEGRHVPLVASNPSLIDALVQMMRRSICECAITVSGCLLTDAGLPSHPSTYLAAPCLLPELVSILESSSTSFHPYDWKRLAVSAICNAIMEPTGQDTITAGSVEVELRNLVTTYLWSKTLDSDGSDRESRMQALVDTLSFPDTSAVVSGLLVLNRLLRWVPPSCLVFESCSGVAALEHICERAAGQTHALDLDLASQLAANLLDDLFDDGHDEDDPFVNKDAVPSNTTIIDANSNQLFFGFSDRSPISTPLFDFSAATSNGSSAFDSARTSVTAPPAGRGRGRTLPAWMQHS